jgi:RES domain-containing protein
MKVYRITKNKFIDYILHGIGAKISGNRWNSVGIPMVYTAENSSLAMLEILVHLDRDLIPNDFVLVSLEIPNSSIQNKSRNSLNLEGSKKYGDDWINSSKSLILKVPSAINPRDYNYLINPLHPDIIKIKVDKIEELNFDLRLIS